MNRPLRTALKMWDTVPATMGERTMEKLALAKDVKEGMRLDLQGDFYADPEGNNPHLEFEYAVVTDVEEETSSCVRVDTTEGSFGFPPDHALKEINVAEKLVPCPMCRGNGYVYDEDVAADCPHCNSQGEVTEASTHGF